MILVVGKKSKVSKITIADSVEAYLLNNKRKSNLQNNKSVCRIIFGDLRGILSENPSGV